MRAEQRLAIRADDDAAGQPVQNRRAEQGIGLSPRCAQRIGTAIGVAVLRGQLLDARDAGRVMFMDEARQVLDQPPPRLLARRRPSWRSTRRRPRPDALAIPPATARQRELGLRRWPVRRRRQVQSGTGGRTAAWARGKGRATLDYGTPRKQPTRGVASTLSWSSFFGQSDKGILKFNGRQRAVARSGWGIDTPASNAAAPGCKTW